jgi:hypothetical protein
MHAQDFRKQYRQVHRPHGLMNRHARCISRDNGEQPPRARGQSKPRHFPTLMNRPPLELSIDVCLVARKRHP